MEIVCYGVLAFTHLLVMLAYAMLFATLLSRPPEHGAPRLEPPAVTRDVMVIEQRHLDDLLARHVTGESRPVEPKEMQA